MLVSRKLEMRVAAQKRFSNFEASRYRCIFRYYIAECVATNLLCACETVQVHRVEATRILLFSVFDCISIIISNHIFNFYLLSIALTRRRIHLAFHFAPLLL